MRTAAAPETATSLRWRLSFRLKRSVPVMGLAAIGSSAMKRARSIDSSSAVW